MFCKNCGTQLEDTALFCSKCGTQVVIDDFFGESDSNFVNTQATESTDTANSADDLNDINDNKVMAVLSYIGILVLVPIFGAKNSKYAQYHASQGLSLFLCTMGYSLCYWLITFLLGLIFKPSYSYLFGYTPNPIVSLVSVVLGLGSIFFLVLAIMGIVNAVSGKKAELPLIGKIDILKKCK